MLKKITRRTFVSSLSVLAATPLLGLRTNARFLADLVDHMAFRTGAMHTGLIDQWQADGDADRQRKDEGCTLAHAVGHPFGDQAADRRDRESDALREDDVVQEADARHQDRHHAGDCRVESERGGEVDRVFLHVRIMRACSGQGKLQAHGDAVAVEAR